MIAAWRVPPENPKREYIDREAAIKTLDEYIIDHPIFTDRDAARAVKAKLDTVPAADVRPVKRGRWTRRTYDSMRARDKCSVCGAIFDRSTDGAHWSYCPNCGAEMEGTE